MKQAAELLEEALKEAGGSIRTRSGTNPLFAEGNRLEPRVGNGRGRRMRCAARNKKGRSIGLQKPLPSGVAPAAPSAEARPAAR